MQNHLEFCHINAGFLVLFNCIWHPVTLTEMTPIWISCSIVITAQSGWQDNHIKATAVSLWIRKKNAAGRFQSCTHFPILIWLLQYGAIYLSSILQKAERKLQLCLHAYQVGISVCWCVPVVFGWEGATRRKLGLASKQKSVCVASFPAILFHTASYMGWYGQKTKAAHLIPVVPFWFINCSRGRHLERKWAGGQRDDFLIDEMWPRL